MPPADVDSERTGPPERVSLPDASQELVLDQEYDKLADWVRESLNMDLVYQMSGLSRDFEQLAGQG